MKLFGSHGEGFRGDHFSCIFCMLMSFLFAAVGEGGGVALLLEHPFFSFFYFLILS
jgi:hypothetical protein